jgi:protein tyrosine phosphatase (PTP) superfamily phosphohydrolase (DUF442 family)
MSKSNPDSPNFRAVTDGSAGAFWLFRGGQPSKVDLEYLARDAGIKTVICLRRRRDDWEHRLTQELGIELIYLPMPLRLKKLSSRDFLEILQQFFQAVTASPRNIFVHCDEGIDRTGLMIGLLRIYKQGWTFDAAYKEMIECGYRGFPHQILLSSFREVLFDWWSKKHNQQYDWSSEWKSQIISLFSDAEIAKLDRYRGLDGPRHPLLTLVWSSQ